MAKIYAILGDIHANIDALETVLADAREQGVTDYVSVGDVVGYNAAPAECIRIVRDELKCPVVRGNHDHYVAYVEESLADFHPMAAAVVEWTRSQLSEDDLRWLHDLPLSRPVMGFTIVHATLDMPLRWGYVFENPTDFKVELGQRLFINVGSVGQPRDGDPRASYVIYDSGTRTIRFRRLSYDVAAAQARIRAAGLPERLAARLETGK